ncbi:P2Y purinoceptor 1-like protein [Lates japonicus]|uniref:P2Y purinoceptor 1-like protein n=1 Tax=Lates japonicus TaxID=270547 RepID=A0AAD3MSC0_LATJO|nr:P2Y purinoceptor 1-like protein [Lates japonicus]
MTVRVLRRLPRGRRHRGAQRAGGKPLRLITAAILVFVVSFVPYHIMVITLNKHPALLRDPSEHPIPPPPPPKNKPREQRA